jgi:hypothetical protein
MTQASLTDPGQVTVVRHPHTDMPVAVTLTDDEHRILKVLWEAPDEIQYPELEDEALLEIFDNARLGSTKPSGYLRGVRAVVAAVKRGTKVAKRRKTSWTERVLISKQDLAFLFIAGCLAGGGVVLLTMPYLQRGGL